MKISWTITLYGGASLLAMALAAPASADCTSTAGSAAAPESGATVTCTSPLRTSPTQAPSASNVTVNTNGSSAGYSVTGQTAVLLGSNATVNVNAGGQIATSGDDAIGVDAGANSSVTVSGTQNATGQITTQGERSTAIRLGEQSRVDVSGRVVTNGSNANAVVVGGNSTVTVQNGGIVRSNSGQSNAIFSTGSGVTVNVNEGAQVATSSSGSNPISLSGSGATVQIGGLVTSSAGNSDAVSLTGANSTVTVTGTGEVRASASGSDLISATGTGSTITLEASGPALAAGSGGGQAAARVGDQGTVNVNREIRASSSNSLGVAATNNATINVNTQGSIIASSSQATAVRLESTQSSSTNRINVNQGASIDASGGQAIVASGSGREIVQIDGNVTGQNGAAVVELGGGTDELTVSSTGTLSAPGSNTLVDGGDGMDTVNLANAATYQAARFRQVEQLNATGSGTTINAGPGTNSGMTISAGSMASGGGGGGGGGSGPTVNVNEGADLGTVRASGNGTANINSGGRANRLEVSGGGTGNVNSGGTVDTLSVSGGSSTARVGGTANSVDTSGGGTVNVSSGGTVNNVSSGSGGTVNLESGSNASLSPDSGQGGSINTASGSNVTVQGNSSGGNQSQRVTGANFGSGTNISVGNSPFLTGSAAGDTISLGLEDLAFTRLAQGGNQRAVAGALDVLADSTSPRAQQILGGVVLASDPQALFNDLSGQVYASAVQSGMATQRTFALGLRSRAEASAPVPEMTPNVPVLGYTGLPQSALPNLALAADAPFAPTEAAPAPGFAPAVAQGYGVFIGGYGGSLDYDGTGNVLGYDSDTYGGMIGVETGLAALGYGEGVAGIALGYAQTDVDVDGTRSDADIDSYQVGIYAGGNFRGFDLAGSLGYGYQEVDIDRRIGLPSGTVATGGDFDGHLVSASLSASYNLAAGFADGLVFAPKATYDLIYADYGDGAENGGTIADLRFQGGDYTQHIAGVGLLLGAETAMNGVVLRPEIEIMYEHVGGDSQIAQTLSFAGTDAAFAIASSEEVDERMRIGAGLGIGFTDDLSAKVSYEGIFGDDLEGHSVAASLRLAF
jgi:uncharacterized protein with beta-barrel porin domain